MGTFCRATETRLHKIHFAAAHLSSEDRCALRANELLLHSQIILAYLFHLLSTLAFKILREVRVRKCQDLDRKQAGVASAGTADRHGSYRNAAGHLHDGE